MKLFTIYFFVCCLLSSASAYGQSSNSANRRIQYSLAVQLEQHRLIQATIARIRKMPLGVARRNAIKELKRIIHQVKRDHGNNITPDEKRESRQRQRYEHFYAA